MTMILRPREVASAHTALGLQFADVATNAPVTGGLRVTAQLLDNASRRAGRLRTARANPAGIYAFFGLHPEEQTEWEFGTFLQRRRRAVIDVEDPARRFLPTSFVVPLPQRGPFRGVDDDGLEPVGGQPPQSLAVALPRGSQLQGVALFSAPGRPLLAGLTALRAQLVVGGAADPPPAPFAVVRIFTRDEDGDEQLHAIGMADERGVVTLPLRYPRINPDDDPDPPPSLGRRTFDLAVRVAFDAAARDPLPGSTAPDLGKLLGQAERRVAIARDAATEALTLRDGLPVVLRYGEEAVLRTGITGTGEFEGVLRLAP
jgi:hypothetical protein